jgi:hypothetical protein
VEHDHDHVDHILEEWERERPDLDLSAMAVIARISRASRILDFGAGAQLPPFGFIHQRDAEFRSSAAALTDLGSEGHVEQIGRLPACRDHRARAVDRHEFELAPANGAEDRLRRHEHPRAGLARRGAQRLSDLDQRDGWRSVSMRRSSDRRRVS